MADRKDPLKEKFHKKSSALRTEIRALVKEHGAKVVGDVTLGQVFGGARGIKTMMWETSELDAYDGIRFRGFTIPQLRDKLPTAPGGGEPLPEGLFWLMLTGDLPTKTQVKWLSKEWRRRGKIPKHVYDVLKKLPADTHPMTQFTIGITAMGTESVFDAKYAEGMNKKEYWDATYEDSMNLIARLPHLAAFIYSRAFGDGKKPKQDRTLDWAANYAHMMGFGDGEFQELMRLYLTIHADHEGGNASAHTAFLVNSTLANVYVSLSSAINSLSGPLHGLANQEVIKWVFAMLDKLGTKTPTKAQIQKYVQETLDSGRVIPGYGHAVLRQPDPRFTAQRGFAERNIPNDELVQVIWKIFEVVPPELEKLGKVRNPWPNVDAHSGALLVHYGMNQYNYYTVLFGVSRALGVLSALCWSRALGQPLERPKSVTSEWMKAQIKEA